MIKNINCRMAAATVVNDFSEYHVTQISCEELSVYGVKVVHSRHHQKLLGNNERF